LQTEQRAVDRQVSAELDGQAGLLTYELDGDVMGITHVRVPRAIRDRGVAAQLMRSALEMAAANGWSVKPICPYAVTYMTRHPEERKAAHLEDLLDEALEESLSASDPPSVGGSD
jgi:uncharacterized protein